MLDAATVQAINYQVNQAVTHCPGAWSCTADWTPATYGDCKQLAALKLQRLILAGARPDEFTIWIVRVPAGRHAVLVQNATGLVLDWLPPEPRALKERHEAMTFLAPCNACGYAARITAWAQLYTPAAAAR